MHSLQARSIPQKAINSAGLDEVVGEHRHHHVETEVSPLAPAQVTGGVDCRSPGGPPLHHRLGHDWIHFAPARSKVPGWVAGIQLSRLRSRGPEPSQRRSLAILNKGKRHRLQRTTGEHRRILSCLSFEVVIGLAEWIAPCVPPSGTMAVRRTRVAC